MPRSVILGLVAVSTVVFATWAFVRPARVDAPASTRSDEWRVPAPSGAADDALSASPNAYPLGLRVVRDEDGLPIAGARASFAEADAPGVPPDRITDADGRARWMFPRDIAWTLIVEARDRVVVRKTIGVVTRKVDVRLRRLREPSNAVGAGSNPSSMPGLIVRLVDERGAELLPADLGLNAEASRAITVCVSDACGAPGDKFGAHGGVLTSRAALLAWDGSRFGWKLTFASLGSACVQVVVGERILASRMVESATGELDLPIDRAQLELAREPFMVRVRSSGDRGPIKNARVSASTTSGYTVRHSTDEEGRARFADLLALEFELEAAVSGHVPARCRVQRPLDAEIEFTLQPGRDLRGTLWDESGHPVPNGTIGVFRWPAQGPSELHIARTTSDADGRFVLTDVPRDTLVLIGTDDDSPPVLTKGTEPWTCPVDAGGGVEGLVIRLLHVEPPFPPIVFR